MISLRPLDSGRWDLSTWRKLALKQTFSTLPSVATDRPSVYRYIMVVCAVFLINQNKHARLEGTQLFEPWLLSTKRNYRTTQSLKTEPRITKENYTHFCKVHIWNMASIVKDKYIKIKSRIYVPGPICVWLGRWMQIHQKQSIMQNIIVIKLGCHLSVNRPNLYLYPSNQGGSLEHTSVSTIMFCF